MTPTNMASTPSESVLPILQPYVKELITIAGPNCQQFANALDDTKETYAQLAANCIEAPVDDLYLISGAYVDTLRGVR
ncbi:hypothetical protein BGX23_006639 [Mortierella sp. AD031]|nr:hypothetical protein BGX23_006639 [Mortierella sp. AD031]